MKKVLYLVVTLVLLFTLVACGNENTSEESDSDKKELVRKIVLDGETEDEDVLESAIIGMSMSDAKYFTVSFDEGTPGVESSHHNMYSVGEADFNEISPIDPWQFSDLVTDGVKDFLNCSYADINRPAFNGSNSSTAFGNMQCNSMAERTIAPLFNGSVEGYFDEHRLSLSCDETTLDQIAVYEIYDHYSYIFGVKANVTTTECTGDMSDLGYFANKGESKDITLYLVCDYYAEDNTISISYMNIK